MSHKADFKSRDEGGDCEKGGSIRLNSKVNS